MHPLIERLGVDECLRRCLGTGYRDMEAFLFFCNFVYIPHKFDRSNVCLADVLTDLQIEVAEAIRTNQFTYILKSRKEGISTLYAAWNLRHIWLIENFESLILSLDDISTIYIKSIYQYIYDHIPEELKVSELTHQNKHEMKFDTGGYLRSMTASTDGVRGSTPRSIHASEFAQYADIKKTLESAFQAGTEDAEVVLETTALGMNKAYDMWEDNDNGYKKVFISWRNSPNCRANACVSKTPQELIDAQIKHKFTDAHLNWATDRYNLRCGSSWDTFCQEYPMDPEDAFIASGTRFFKGISFKGVKFNEGTDQGYIEYVEPSLYKRYSCGVDVASGSPKGDFSSFVINDCCDRLNPFTVATFYERITVPAFAEVLHKYLSRYHDPLLTIEMNGPGLGLHERMRERGYANFYRRKIEDAITGMVSERLGWLTTEASRYIIFSKLLAHFKGGWWGGFELEKFKVIDKRLQFEINSIIYNKKGKIMHAPSKHDDITFACGLSLQGMDQSWENEPVIARKRPRNIREMLQFEAESMLLMEDLPYDYFDDYDPTQGLSEENFPETPGLS